MILILDTETTGLNPLQDEILQLSVIDMQGNVRFDSYFHPAVDSWADAQKVNHITPEMVENAPTIFDSLAVLNDLFRDASLIIGYNPQFDLAFLRSAGIVIPNCAVFDCMEQFAYEFGEWSDVHDSYKFQKLTTAAEYFHFRWGILPPHNSLSDCYATRFVYFHLCASRYCYGFLNDGISGIDEENILAVCLPSGSGVGMDV